MILMGNSIQENLKKINSSLSRTDCLALLILAIFLGVFTVYTKIEEENRTKPVVYIKNTGEVLGATTEESTRPFASKNGTTYTFSWCSGSGNIKDANRIYYANELQAQASGKRLSKLCQK